MLIVPTGAGKGKTSAALGMVVRAAGHGMKVGVVQFVKGAMATGEAAVLSALPGVEFRPMGDGFTWDPAFAGVTLGSRGGRVTVPAASPPGGS